MGYVAPLLVSCLSFCLSLIISNMRANVFWIIFFSFFAFSCNGKAGQVSRVPVSDTVEVKNTVNPASILDSAVYTKQDSIEVEDLLRKEVKGNDVLFYARHFIGRPYVAHTLEISDPEKLIVNLKELDCTTLVETACALAMTKRQGGDKFADYCKNLESLRYWNGNMNGYLSRLHYFTWWMHDNMRRGLFSEVTNERYFTAPMVVKNYYMSQHASSYKMLAAHPEWKDSIAILEKEWNGPDGKYLPESNTILGTDKLGFIKDGDVIAIVTTKAGLDYAHLGFAVWGDDGKLHLLNASMVYKKVVEDKTTLYDYLMKWRSATGIRLMRLE